MAEKFVSSDGKWLWNPEKGDWDAYSSSPSQSTAEQQKVEKELSDARALAESKRNAAAHGQRFLQNNVETGTGRLEMLMRLPVIGDAMRVAGSYASPKHTNNLSNMDSISDQMVLEGMQQLAAIQANTPEEQARLRRTVPNLSNSGPQNRRLVAELDAQSEIATALLAAKENYKARSGGTLNGFDREWAGKEDEIRKRVYDRWKYSDKAPTARSGGAQQRAGSVVVWERRPDGSIGPAQ